MKKVVPRILFILEMDTIRGYHPRQLGIRCTSVLSHNWTKDNYHFFLLKYDLGKKNYTSQVQPYQGSNLWPSVLISVLHCYSWRKLSHRPCPFWRRLPVISSYFCQQPDRRLWGLDGQTQWCWSLAATRAIWQWMASSTVWYVSLGCWMTPGLSKAIQSHTSSKLANNLIRHQATHKVGCQPGDGIWSL